ncbi:MAG: hypothetical protein KJ858_00650 [Nanoarchaeota archaeon]|nr:hypothetical protein [Nanoarchaeota archaeon]
MKKSILTKLNLNKSQRTKERDALILRMGAKEKNIRNMPVIISNEVEDVINPAFVAKMHSQYGFPKEMTLEEISKRLNIKYKDYWSEWCDFWFNSLIKIPHTILLNSKKYYQAMEVN